MTTHDSTNKEFPYGGILINGFVALAIAVAATVLGLAAGFGVNDSDLVAGISIAILAIFWILTLSGFFIQQPNQARVAIFFGKYKGTLTSTGFYWINPFMTLKKISLRIRNMDIAPIKVNDKIGNPVMIGMVLVWKVKDTYRVVFDIDSQDSATNTKALDMALTDFVRIQSDAALREVTGRYAYDDTGTSHEEITLRSGGTDINDLLERKINERLAMAGIEVVEARINYLAYAPEIAAVMLRRQQASAVISAREKIVEGAVSMVKMALQQIERDNIVRLDEESKAAMVSSLLVVLCSDEPATPVLNAGS